MDDIVIVSAARTPVGSFQRRVEHSSCAATRRHRASRGDGERAGIDPSDVDELIYGQVLAAGEGQNPTRQAARALPASPIQRPPSESTKSAGQGFGPSHSPRSRSGPVRAISSPPAGWRA